MILFFKGLYEETILRIFLWAAFRMDLPVWSIYAPGDDDDAFVKGWVLAESPETLDLILSGKTYDAR